MSVSGSAAKAAKRPGCFWQIAENPSLTRRHSGKDTSSGCDSIQQNEPSSDSTLVSTPWRSIRARWNVDVIERLGERLFAHPRLQHLDAVVVAQDARFLGAGAQGVGDLGGPPMGVHVDHGVMAVSFAISSAA